MRPVSIFPTLSKKIKLKNKSSNIQLYLKVNRVIDVRIAVDLHY